MANNDITFVRPEVRAALPVWKKIRDVCKGPDAVKAAGNAYLPYLDPSDKSSRNKKRNEAYIERAVFYAVTGNTKIGLVGMAFRKDPTLTAPEKLSYVKKNADGAGTSIYQQAQQVLENVLEVARDGLYVDYAEASGEAIVLRYQAENIINWRTERINGRDQLMLVVLRECIEEPDGYGFKEINQYRELLLENGRFICRVWRRTGDTQSGPYAISSNYHPKPKGEQYWDEIPFTFVGAQNNDPTIDESPLEALTEINLGHFRNSADYEDSVFFCGQVQPVISGLDTTWRDWLQEKGIRVGSRSPFLLPKEASFTYAQAEPNTLAKEAMDSKRDYMVQLGARLIEQNSAVKTATQATGEQTSSTSVLGICVANVTEAYSRVLAWCARYLGVKNETTEFVISQEFIAKIAESGMLTAIVNAWQVGAIRDEDMVRAMQKLDIIDPSADPDTVMDAMRNRSPTLIGGNNDLGE